MFTQCPECGTVFRVTATVLRAAQGQVRCGVCDASFDALRYLSDSVDGPPAAREGEAGAADEPPPAPPIARPTATRNTPSEDEGRALAQLSARRAAAPSPARPPEPEPEPDLEEEINVLEPTDVEDIVLDAEGPDAAAEIPDEALEFDVPPGEWDRVFVKQPALRTPLHTPLDINLSALEPPASAPAAEATDSHRFVILEEPDAGAAADTSELKLVEEDALSRTDEYAALDADAQPAAGERIEEAWFEPSRPRAVPADAEAPAPFELPPAASEGPATLRRRAYAAGVALLGLALVVQLVHFNREALAASAWLGPAVGGLYARLGAPIEPHWDLAAYEVKQWGAATDAAPGALRLRASIINKAARAQPYPLLRVTLEDRFGSRIARGEFRPDEYLPGRAPPTGLLAGGARADADLMLDDPGSQAVGFELDVCLPRGAALLCGAEQKAAGSG